MRGLETFVSKQAQSGVTLIEVLVSVLILAVGLLGIAAMQATALRNSQSSFEQTQAVAQTYAAFDILRARRDAAVSGAMAIGSAGAPHCSASTFSGAVSGITDGQTELNGWYHAVKQSLGTVSDSSTCAVVACVANAIAGATCTVTVQWDDSRGTSMGTGAGSASRKVTTVGDV